MSGRPPRLAAPGAVLMAVAVAACANLPTSGGVPLHALRGAGGSGQSIVQIAPVAPRNAWQPDQIVKGFLLASASSDQNVARLYLTRGKHGYSRKWKPGWAATIIDSPDVKWKPPPHGVQVPSGGPLTTTVTVTGNHLETLQTAGRYQAGSVVVGPASTVFRFSLIQVGGQWRIEGITVNNAPAPRNLLLMSQDDFERFYQPRNLYFYPQDPDAKTLVPDPVYIPQQAGGQGIAGLVKTLLTPPTSASWLYQAATTAFPRGTTVIRAQVSNGITAVVDLGGAAARATRAQRQRMAAQLLWSLGPASTPYPAQVANPIRSVILQINGRPVQQQVQGYSDWVPPLPGTPLYYQAPGNDGEPAAAVMRTSATQSAQVQLPGGLAGGLFSHLAASKAQTGSAVLAGCSGKTVYLMPQAHAGEVITTRLPTPCTSLSWDGHGNLWIAASSQVFEIHGAGSRPPARPALDDVFVGFGSQVASPQFRDLRVAPDGVRAAMILRSGSSVRIQVAAISTSNATTYLGQNTQDQGNPVLRVGSDVSDPQQLCWLDPDHLLVLGKSGAGHMQLYEVPLNGGKSTPVATPRGVTSVASAWSGSPVPPRIVVAIAPSASAPGRIEQSANGLPNPDWQLVVKGTTPVYPG